FVKQNDSVENLFNQVLTDNRKAPPLRPCNRAVSPAVEAIVHRCLDPDSDSRYQSAADLREDLDRQRMHLTLRHAPEPSLRERVQKWIRRHPGGTSAGSLVAVSIGALIVLSLLFFVRSQQLAWMQECETAQRAFQQFQQDLRTVQFLLYTRHTEPDQRE